MKTQTRHFLSIFLAIIMVISVQIFCFAREVSAESPPVVYVSPNGNDTAGDGTYDAPFATLKKAFTKIDTKSGATIVLMGNVESENNKAWNKAYDSIKGHDGLLTLTGKDPVSGEIFENAKLRYDSPAFEGPVKLEYLSLVPARDYSFIDTSGYDFTMGKGITNEDFQVYVHDGINPGAGKNVVSGTNTVIESGSIHAFYIGGGYPTSTNQGVSGDCRLTVNGGMVSSVIVGFDKYKDTHTEAFIDGNVVITINSGSVYSVTQKQLLDGKIGGHLAVVSNSGAGFPNVSPIDAQKGTYLVKSGRNGTVSATEEAGVFSYQANSKYSCYVDGKMVEGGVFSVAPGEYSVVFMRFDGEDFKGAYAEGFPGGYFYPDEKLTRAQAVQLITKASGGIEKDTDFESAFSDISRSDWYYKAVAYMEEYELLPEEWESEFLPNEYITRGEFIYIVDGRLVKNAASAKLLAFSDVTDDSTPYYNAIMSAVMSDCINGYDDGTFRPENVLTRAEAITVLNRYLSRTPVDGAESGFLDVDEHWARSQIVAATADISENKWTHNTDGNSGDSYVMPKGKDNDAEDYITSLYAQSSSLSAKAVRNGVDVISEQMKKDIINTPNTLEIYGTKVKGKVYYISEKGSDTTGDGTVTKPFRSIAGLKSKVTLRSGNAVLFERGGIYRESFSVTSGVVYGSYGEGDKPIIMQSKKNYADPSLWKKTEWENVWVCTDKLMNVGVIGFDHDLYDYSDDTYDELYGVIMNKNMYGFMEPSQLCGDLQFYSELNGDVQNYGDLYVYSKDGNPGERFESIEIGERINIISGSPAGVIIDNISFKFTGGHGIGFGTCSDVTVTNCVFSWLGGSVLSLDFHGGGSPVNYGNAVEIYGGCNGYYVENNWMYQIYDTAVTHQRSSSLGDCIQENVRYAKNLMEYVFWGIEFYNSPPSASQLNGAEDTYTRITRNVTSEYNVLRLGGYGWGSIVRHRGSLLYCGSALSENYDCYTRYNIFDRAYGNLLNLTENSNEYIDKNIYIQFLGQKLGKLKTLREIMCDYSAKENIEELFGDKNAVVIVIDTVLEPVSRRFPEGWIEPNALG